MVLFSRIPCTTWFRMGLHLKGGIGGLWDMIKEYSKNRIHTWTCSLNYIYIIHYTVYSIHVFYVFSLHESPIVLLPGGLKSLIADSTLVVRRRSTSSMWCPRWPVFFSNKNSGTWGFFFCEKNGSMDIHSLGFSIGGGFKKQEGSPLFGEDSHFWLTCFNWVEATN